MLRTTTLALAAAAVLALTACDGAQDPTETIQAWLQDGCPAAADVEAATGLDLGGVLDEGMADPTAQVRCAWGAGAADPSAPLIIALATRGDAGGEDWAELPTRAEVEAAGGVYTEVPALGANAFTAGLAQGGSSMCGLYTSAGEGSERLNLVVNVLGGTDATAEDLCDAAVATAQIPAP